MGVQPRVLSRRELVTYIKRWEPQLRKLGSDWADDIPTEARATILRIANSMLRVLLRER